MASSSRRAEEAAETDGEEDQTTADEAEDSKKEDDTSASERRANSHKSSAHNHHKKSHKKRILHPKRSNRVLSTSLWNKIRRILGASTSKPIKFDVKKDLKVSLIANIDKPTGLNLAGVSKESAQKKNADELVKNLLPTILSSQNMAVKALLGLFLLFLVN
jgi:hypothetical protein